MDILKKSAEISIPVNLHGHYSLGHGQERRNWEYLNLA